MNSNEKYDHLFKIIVVGNSGVGKTSILNRYVDQIFPQDHFTTIGVDFKIKTLNIFVGGVSKTVKLQIWDTAGQERFQAISASYFRGSQGMLLVFALDDLKSFERLEHWIDLANEHKIMQRILIGNKADVTKREVTEQMINDYERMTRMVYIEASAKTGQSINELFSIIATNLTERAIMDNDKEGKEGIRLEGGNEGNNTNNGGGGCCGTTGK